MSEQRVLDYIENISADLWLLAAGGALFLLSVSGALALAFRARRRRA